MLRSALHFHSRRHPNWRIAWCFVVRSIHFFGWFGRFARFHVWYRRRGTAENVLYDEAGETAQGVGRDRLAGNRYTVFLRERWLCRRRRRHRRLTSRMCTTLAIVGRGEACRAHAAKTRSVCFQIRIRRRGARR